MASYYNASKKNYQCTADRISRPYDSTLGVPECVLLGAAGFVILSCCFASGSLAATLIADAVLVLAFLYLLVMREQFVLKYPMVFFAIAGDLVGCSVVELMPMYLSELECNSSFAGSVPLLALSHLALISTLLVYDSHKGIEHELGVTNRIRCMTTSVQRKLLLPLACIAAGISIALSSVRPPLT